MSTSRKGPQHLAQDGSRAGVARSVAVVLVAGLLGALALEAATLFGAPASSVLRLADWNARRIMAYAVLCMAAALWVALRGRETWAACVAFWRADGCRNLKHAGIQTLVAALLSGGCFVVLVAVLGLTWRSALAASSVLICVWLLIANRAAIAQAFEWGFLAVALPLGIAICVLMPPSVGFCWDGAIHFDCAQALSYILNPQYTGADALMATAGGPSVEDVYGVQSYTPVFPSVPQRGVAEIELPLPQIGAESIARAEEELLRVEQDEAVTIVAGAHRLSGGSSLGVTMFGRLPLAFGLWLGRLMHAGPSVRYCMGRLANLLFYILVFFAGMRRLRSGKQIVGVVALTPLSLLLAASYSYDGWCTCLIGYAVCRFVGELQHPEDPIDVASALGILVPFTLGCLVKAIFAPLALMFLALGRDKFKEGGLRRATYGLLVCCCVMFIVATFAMPFFFSVQQGSASGDARGGSDVNAGRQVAYVLANPLSYARVVGVFTLEFFHPTNLNHLLYDYANLVPLGTTIGWIVSIVQAVLGVYVFATDMVDADYRWHLSARMRLAVCALVVCSYVLVVSSMYVSFTPVGLDTVNGVQYRYMYPLYLPLGLLCANGLFGLVRNVSEKAAAKAQMPVLGTTALLLSATILDVFFLR